jgi:L,D-transpeptidase YbiS
MQSFLRKIHVSVATQTLTLREVSESGDVQRVLAVYPVSTSGVGLGTEPGSQRTPTGRFKIGEMIGADAPLGAVFKARVLTGEIADFQSPGDPSDAITTRILWLEGLEPHNANTKERYIYIHGTNHEEQIGVPCSHGCVRMRNEEVAALFEAVVAGVEVVIEAPERA